MAEQSDIQSLIHPLADRMDRQGARLDQFNIIFLDVIRGIKKDIKELTEVVLKQHEGRLKRLEDFMDGFLRKAG